MGALAGLLVLIAGGIWFYVSRTGSDSPTSRPLLSGDVLQRACDLPAPYLERIYRGSHPAWSEEIVIVPREPNFVGSFDLTSHSGPWPYLQRIPLVFYGPGYIEAQGEVETPATMADVYPTVGRLLDVDLEEREGRVLEEALISSDDLLPKLIVTVVWDGAGRATLERWGDRWPNLKRIVEGGTSYAKATVGSSPSVTSAVHSTLATGAYPRSHGVTGNELRNENGDLIGTFAGSSPDDLELTTSADQVDQLLNNKPKVGMLAWNRWHLGMLGHGNTIRGADDDEMALIHFKYGLRVNGADAFAQVESLEHAADLDEEIAALDREDGAMDEQWLGNDIALPASKAPWDLYSNPAWARVHAKLAVEMLRKGRYGQDSVPDLWMTNLKMTDLAGHRWGLESQETAAVLEAQDEALGTMLEYLDEEVGDYVVVLTADHGTAPLATDTGAWPILQDELIKDVNEHFDVPDSDPLIESSAAAAYFIDPDVAEDSNVSLENISAFLNDYTIEQNWTSEELPEGYGGRGEEQVFSAVFPTEELDAIRDCASG